MAPSGAAGGIEHRLTAVERDLSNHIQTCERNSTETKYWVRFIGGCFITGLFGGFGYLLKLGIDALLAHH